MPLGCIPGSRGRPCVRKSLIKALLSLTAVEEQNIEVRFTMDLSLRVHARCLTKMRQAPVPRMQNLHVLLTIKPFFRGRRLPFHEQTSLVVFASLNSFVLFPRS